MLVESIVLKNERFKYCAPQFNVCNRYMTYKYFNIVKHIVTPICNGELNLKTDSLLQIQVTYQNEEKNQQTWI